MSTKKEKRIKIPSDEELIANGLPPNRWQELVELIDNEGDSYLKTTLLVWLDVVKKHNLEYQVSVFTYRHIESGKPLNVALNMGMADSNI